jgi:TolB protein
MCNHTSHRAIHRWFCFLSLVLASNGWTQTPGLGSFENHRDIGAVSKPGSVDYNAARQTYEIAGGGDNMWATNDAFHILWKRVSGDLTLTADIRWIGTGGNAHRKACLIVRQGLEANSPYIDAALHGNGLTSLQFREVAGGPTREVQVAVTAPRRLGLARQGDFFVLTMGSEDGDLQSSGGAFKMKLADPVYVGLAVCAHDNNARETAVFSRVQLVNTPARTAEKPVLHSVLETVAIGSKDRKVVYHSTNLLEAPNWSRDGKFLIFNAQGRLQRIPIEGGRPETIDTGFANRCNNDHGISPDGRQIAISDQSQEKTSLIYILPINGGQPKRITAVGPSYWHGWSPDGLTLAYCAQRNGEFDIYSIPVAGGEERRLTTATGLDDGPDYSADGQWIYFNSERTGTMQIWRMKPDGSGQEPVTSDSYNNWFPHPSPDGRWLVFLSYGKEVKGHPANQDVQLRLLPLMGGEAQVLATLFGGQGTINVPSWSPDGRQLAFVSYHYESPPAK